MRKNNLAGRIGAWAAANPKDAIFGWIAFVAIAVALGAYFGTKPMPSRDRDAPLPSDKPALDAA
jgi:hypothetical protein